MAFVPIYKSSNFEWSVLGCINVKKGVPCIVHNAKRSVCTCIRATLNVREKPNLGKTTKFAIHGELLQRDLPYNPDAEFRSLLVI